MNRALFLAALGAKLRRYLSNHDQGSGAIDAATSVITPVSHWDSKWLWWSFRHGMLGGQTPTYTMAKAARFAAPAASENLGVWAKAADTETWYKFDNQTVGATDISLSHDTPFPVGKIYIAQLPMYPWSRVARKVSGWLANSYVSDAASETGGVIDYATARDAGDSSGRTAPALPFYGFKLTNATENTKNKAILTAYNHPNETQGAWQLEGALDWLLGGSVLAEFLLDWFEFYVYPCLNPQGVWSGYFRSSPETPASDNNRLWDTTGSNEAVDAFKTAMSADTGDDIELGLDFHGAVGATAGYMVTADHTAALPAAFLAKMQGYDAAFTYDDTVVASMLTALWTASYTPALSMVVEGSPNSLQSIPAFWKTQGENTLKSIAAMHSEGRWTNGPGVGSRSFNGTTDRIDFATAGNLAGNALTISLWANFASFPANGYMLCIHAAGDTGYGIVLNINDAANKYINLIVKGSTDLLRSAQGLNLATGTWTNIIATWTGDITKAADVTIYKNGTAAPGYVTSTNGATQTAPAGSWSLGGRKYDDTRNYPGKLAQVGVWNRILTAGEIANLAAGYAPDLAAASGLQFYYPGNTDSLTATPGGNGTADGTTHSSGVGNGPAIIYG